MTRILCKTDDLFCTWNFIDRDRVDIFQQLGEHSFLLTVFEQRNYAHADITIIQNVIAPEIQEGVGTMKTYKNKEPHEISLVGFCLNY